MPSKADKVENAFISVNVIKNRRSSFPVGNWIMDSGAFTTIAKHGLYPEDSCSFPGLHVRGHHAGKDWIVDKRPSEVDDREV